MILQSDAPEFAVPDFPVHEMALRRAGETPHKLALLDLASGRSFTFLELREAAARVAAGVQARGFQAGDVFAIACPNGAEFVLAYYAVLSLGGIVTTLNPAYTPHEMAHQLKDSGAAWLLAAAGILPKALEAATEAGIREVFVAGPGEDGPGATLFSGLEGDRNPSTGTKVDPSLQLAALPYSSGTTGLPKGVMLTHRNLVSNMVQGALFGLEPEDVVLGVLPLFHIFGMNVVMNTGLATGCSLVLMPRFDLEDFLGAIQRHRITFVFLVPPILLALAKHPMVDRFDLSSLRCIISGAAPLGDGLIREVQARLPNCQVRQGYGLTETSPVVLVSPEHGPTPPGSVGRLVAGTECQIVDPASGAVLPFGERGELWLRGPQVMRGYLNRPEDTAQVLDAQGWFHSGDIAIVDPAGFVAIVDRLKELIKVKGMQVAPAELEGLLIGHPAVADAAVIPIPDESAGEIPKGFVVLKPGASATADELMAYVAAQVAPHKRIRVLDLVDQIPKSPSGKILRRVLVEQERAKAVS